MPRVSLKRPHWRLFSVAVGWTLALSTPSPGQAPSPVPAPESGDLPAQPAFTELIRSIDYEPAWSPDGTNLVFVSNRSGAMNLHRLELASGRVVQLTHDAGPDDTPAWSPDGKRLAFVSEVDGNPELYLIDVDGSNLRRLTDHPGVDLHPHWSRESDRLLFNTSRHAKNPADPDRIDVCELTLASGAIHCHTQGGINTYASWSPDGSRILWRRSRGEGRSQIVVLQPQTHETLELTPGDAFDGWPAWRSNTSVLFASDRSGEFQLYAIETKGGPAIRLTDRPGRYTNPRARPQGGRDIVFSGREVEGGDVELYLIHDPVPDSRP